METTVIYAWTLIEFCNNFKSNVAVQFHIINRLYRLVYRRLCTFLQKLLTFNLLLSYSQDPATNIETRNPGISLINFINFLPNQLFVLIRSKCFLAQKRATNQVSRKYLLFRNWLRDRENKIYFVFNQRDLDVLEGILKMRSSQPSARFEDFTS